MANQMYTITSYQASYSVGKNSGFIALHTSGGNFEKYLPAEQLTAIMLVLERGPNNFDPINWAVLDAKSMVSLF
jgi:hypothetical protein